MPIPANLLSPLGVIRNAKRFFRDVGELPWSLRNSLARNGTELRGNHAIYGRLARNSYSSCNRCSLFSAGFHEFGVSASCRLIREQEVRIMRFVETVRT